MKTIATAICYACNGDHRTADCPFIGKPSTDGCSRCGAWPQDPCDPDVSHSTKPSRPRGKVQSWRGR